GADRGALRHLRQPSRARLRQRPAAHPSALLHQRRRHEFQGGRQVTAFSPRFAQDSRGGHFTSTISATPTFLSFTVCSTTKRPAELWSSNQTFLPMTLVNFRFLIASLTLGPSVLPAALIASKMTRMPS